MYIDADSKRSARAVQSLKSGYETLNVSIPMAGLVE
jgi:hypothetical protein